jgi:hypothetical protein
MMVYLFSLMLAQVSNSAQYVVVRAPINYTLKISATKTRVFYEHLIMFNVNKTI